MQAKLLKKIYNTLKFSYFGAFLNKNNPSMQKIMLGIQTAKAGERLPEMANDFEICMKRM